MSEDEVARRFDYHAPSGMKPVLHENVRGSCKRLAHIINALCPESPEKDRAFERLEEVMMWANASIARSIKNGQVPEAAPGNP